MDDGVLFEVKWSESDQITFDNYFSRCNNFSYHSIEYNFSNMWWNFDSAALDGQSFTITYAFLNSSEPATDLTYAFEL